MKEVHKDGVDRITSVHAHMASKMASETVIPSHLDNIFGVDINPESVEITKLSLFLKIAKKEVEFPNLNQHIKCGNSVVKNSDYSEYSFDWQEEFPEIMNDGGFDIIVGNPPWGADFTSIREYLAEEFTQVVRGQYDSFAIFLYQNLHDLLKQDGILGYIIPNELCLEDVNTYLRTYLSEHNIIELINLGLDIFEGVTKPSLIVLVQKSEVTPEVIVLVGVNSEEKKALKNRELSIDSLIRTKSYIRDQASFSTNDRNKFDIWASNEDRVITEIIRANKFQNLGHYLINGRGIDTNKKGRYLICPQCSYLNPPFGVGRAGRVHTKDCVNDECANNAESAFQFLRSQEDSYDIEYIFSEGIFGSQLDLGFDQPGYIGADLKRFHFNRAPRSFKYFGDKLEDSRLPDTVKLHGKIHPFILGKNS